jgi:hypothetical protein
MANSITPVYLGGSRELEPNHPVYSVLRSVTRAVIQSGVPIHVGCQSGADQAVIWSALFAPSFLFVFAVAHTLETTPATVERSFHAGASLTLSAGNPEQKVASFKARFLLRSKAAAKGCSQAVFFQPGPGSLAVARECIKAHMPVFCFSMGEPAPIPSTTGQWQAIKNHSYYSAFQTQFVQAYVWQENPRLF